MTESKPDAKAAEKPEEEKKGGFGTDFLASFVVFLVALPLCIGIAEASGLEPGQGLITGIVGGLLVGLFAGSPLQVSGPAAGLTVIVLGIVTLDEVRIAEVGGDRHQAFLYFGWIVLGAGVVQFLAGLLKLGQWFRAISPAVIKGMLSGIGVIIFSKMFHVMVDDKADGGPLNAFLTIPKAIMKGFNPGDNPHHQKAALIGILTIATIVIWGSLKSKLPKILKMLPAPLLGLAVGAGTAIALGFEGAFVKVPDNMGDIIYFPKFHGDAMVTMFSSSTYWIQVVTVAIVASTETLLCATAVDQLHNGVRTNYDKELMAQGVGNTICGVLGALPMTGVIVRSSANVEAGGKTRWSAVLHGLWLLLFVLFAAAVLEGIPTSCLAAILVYIGYRLVDWRGIPNLKAFGNSEVAIYFITVISIVCIDLLTGVMIGFGLAVMRIHFTFSHLDVKVDDPDGDGIEHIRLDGAATFLRLPLLASKLETLPKDKKYFLNFDNLLYIDHACLNLISSWEKQVIAMGGEVMIEWNSLMHRHNYKDRKAGVSDTDSKLDKSLLGGH